MENEELEEKIKTSIIQINFGAICVQLYGLINNIVFQSSNKNNYPIWYIGPLCIIFMSIFSHNLYKNIYIHQTLIGNSFIYAFFSRWRMDSNILFDQRKRYINLHFKHNVYFIRFMWLIFMQKIF